MNSREKILAAVKQIQPPAEALPGLGGIVAIRFENTEEKFKSVLQGIGGTILTANGLEEVFAYTRQHFTEGDRFITTIEGVEGMVVLRGDEAALSLENLEAAVIRAEFGVAENAAVWVTHASVKIRVLFVYLPAPGGGAGPERHCQQYARGVCPYRRYGLWIRGFYRRTIQDGGY